MTTIFKNEILEIQKGKEKNYIFFYDVEYQFLISSLQLDKFKTNDKKRDKKQNKENKNYVSYNVESIQTINQYIERKDGILRYSDTLNLFVTLGSQLVNLDRNGYVYPFLDLNNILVLNDSLFIYVNGENIVKKERNNTITISKPYKKNFLFSPELYQITELPSVVPSNSWIYSLGSLCVYCLTGKKERERKKDGYKMIIDMIQDTKLYFSILRCIERNPMERLYLYI